MKLHSGKGGDSDQFLRQALVGLLQLKLGSGTSLAKVRALANTCVDIAAGEVPIIGRQQGLDIHRLGSVLRAWHKETRYLSPEGKPSALPLIGKGGLRGLIRAYYSDAQVTPAIEALKKAGLIRKKHRTNHWLPTEAYARISVDSQETLDHVSEGVSRFLETVLNNIQANSKTALLFEQSCKVRRLPITEAAAFRSFVRQQAIAFLTSVDDWLEARAVSSVRKAPKRKTCAAGVFTFAYLDAKNRAKILPRRI
jgi:hypothetical protein